MLEELGKDVDHGNTVAVTGAIELDGRVGEIGGVKQKTIGVERAGIKVFLVPAGDNAREARGSTPQRPDHPCENFSTGVAGAGNPAARGAESARFRHVRRGRKMRPFS